MPQSVISEHITITSETLAKQGISGQNKEKQNYDKNTFHLPRQCLRDGVKSLDFIGFLGRQRRIYTFGRSDRYLRHMETTRDVF